ncbi:hypothetical protein Sjap_004824 [Stephania japonica]|uniref:Uncharacterized protein n=1 Tax=Stephania japonica TaxID=461633 RepID=A0AAP0K352_9MAGN
MVARDAELRRDLIQEFNASKWPFTVPLIVDAVGPNGHADTSNMATPAGAPASTDVEAKTDTEGKETLTATTLA